jgi:RsiW-degrading membrane proteinase PrsW (M82 family)
MFRLFDYLRPKPLQFDTMVSTLDEVRAPCPVNRDAALRVLFLVILGTVVLGGAALYFNGLADRFLAWLVTVPNPATGEKDWHKLVAGGSFAANPMLWRALVLVAVFPPIIEEILKFVGIRIANNYRDRSEIGKWGENRWHYLDGLIVVLAFSVAESLLYGFRYDNVGGQVLGRLLDHTHLSTWAVLCLCGFRWWGLFPAMLVHGAHNAAGILSAYGDFCSRPMSACWEYQQFYGWAFAANAIEMLGVVAFLFVAYRMLRRWHFAHHFRRRRPRYPEW